jgi:hypothetical protein
MEISRSRIDAERSDSGVMQDLGLCTSILLCQPSVKSKDPIIGLATVVGDASEIAGDDLYE